MKTTRHKRNEPPEYYSQKQFFNLDIRCSDFVNSSFVGYFRLPAIWLGDNPVNESDKNELVLQSKLSNGIIISAFQDGYFVFDFRESNYGKQVLVPGYTYSKPRGTNKQPKKTEEAEREVDKLWIERTRLVNVHQFMFAQAIIGVSGESIYPGGFPISPHDLSRNINMKDCIDYNENSESLRNFASSYYSKRSEFQSREVIPVKVANRTAELLEKVINPGGEKAISLFDQLYVAQWHGLEGRIGIALVAIWTVIEHFIMVDWLKHLEKHVMGKSRRKKLLGRDFTSSIILENLEMMGVYDKSLFLAIDRCRKARNAWMHDLKEPTRNDGLNCCEAIDKLVYRHYELDINYKFLSTIIGDKRFPIWRDPDAITRFQKDINMAK